MGSPLGPTLANIFLCHLEEKWLNDCPPLFKPSFYKRYVDDTFLIFDNVSHIPLFLDYLNQQHPNIKFTSETEVNDQLPFLDINVMKENGGFSTSVYRKKTFTGLGTNFHSYIPMRFKISCISTLIHRAYHISSSYFLFDRELKFLKNFFQDNGFPPKLFYYHVKKFLNKIYSSRTTILTAPKQKLFLKLPYYGYVTEKIISDLKKFFDRHYPQLNVTLVSVNSLSIQSFFKHKEALPNNLCSSIIYQYSCVSCNAHYIGSTKRQFQCRIDDHRGCSVRTGLPLQSASFSAIREHSRDKDHVLKQTQFKILRRSNNADLRLLESLFILRNKPDLNTTSPLELNIAL